MDRPLFRGTRIQHMVRILFLLRRCGQQPRDDAPDGAVKWMPGAKRLQALDFWLRSPDYLAAELLKLYDSGAMKDGFDLAAAIVDAREPQVKRLPTTKYRFGAYQAVDDAIATLATPGLVEHRGQLRVDDKVSNRQYWLMAPGERLAADLVTTDPDIFGWYDQRTTLIARVAGNDNGSVLKKRQYNYPSYAGTRSMQDIPPVTDDVRQRLAAGEAAA